MKNISIIASMIFIFVLSSCGYRESDDTRFIAHFMKNRKLDKRFFGYWYKEYSSWEDSSKKQKVFFRFKENGDFFTYSYKKSEGCYVYYMSIEEIPVRVWGYLEDENMLAFVQRRFIGARFVKEGMIVTSKSSNIIFQNNDCYLEEGVIKVRRVKDKEILKKLKNAKGIF